MHAGRHGERRLPSGSMVVFHYLAGAFHGLFLRCQAAGINSAQDAGLKAPIVTTASATLSARSTTSDVVHDKIFIPTIATMGVLAIVALVCCFKIAVKGASNQIPRGANWAVPSHAAADQTYNSDASKNATERNSQNMPSLGRRMSKAQRKSPPPFLPGASNMLSQPFDVEQNLYTSQPGNQLRMSVVPSNPPAPQPDRRNWPAPDAQRMSILSSAQSATEVGSDAAAPSKAKPYSAVGGYGFSNQTPAPAEFGTQRSQPSTLGSQNYNPYDGIDPTYEGEQSGRGYQGPLPNYVDYSKAGPYTPRQGAP